MIASGAVDARSGPAGREPSTNLGPSLHRHARHEHPRERLPHAAQRWRGPLLINCGSHHLATRECRVRGNAIVARRRFRRLLPPKTHERPPSVTAFAGRDHSPHRVAETTPRVIGLAGLLCAACRTSQYQSGGQGQCLVGRSGPAPPASRRCSRLRSLQGRSLPARSPRNPVGAASASARRADFTEGANTCGDYLTLYQSDMDQMNQDIAAGSYGASFKDLDQAAADRSQAHNIGCGWAWT